MIPHSASPSSIRELVESHDRRKIVFDVKRGTCTICFRGSYLIELDDIQTEGELFWWVRRLAEYEWMSTGRLRAFVEVIAAHKGFNLCSWRWLGHPTLESWGWKSPKKEAQVPRSALDGNPGVEVPSAQ